MDESVVAMALGRYTKAEVRARYASSLGKTLVRIMCYALQLYTRLRYITASIKWPADTLRSPVRLQSRGRRPFLSIIGSTTGLSTQLSTLTQAKS